MSVEASREDFSFGRYDDLLLSDSTDLFDQLGSGNLMFAREAHYQALTHLCFSADEGVLLSGGGDGVVHCWQTMDLVDFHLRSEEITPLQSWNEHTLPITGIATGQGTVLTSRAYTASLDQTIRVCLPPFEQWFLSE